MLLNKVRNPTEKSVEKNRCREREREREEREREKRGERDRCCT